MTDLVLQYYNFTATFHPNGSFRSLTHRPTGRIFCDDGTPQSLFEFFLQPPDSRTIRRCYGLDDFRMKVKEDAERGIVWTGATADGAVGVDYEARVQRGGLLRFRLIVSNNGDLPVHQVTFPRLPGLHAGAGQRVAVPYSTGWSLDPDRLHDGEAIVLNYPVHASMQWMDLYTRDAGLYVGVHDNRPLLKHLEIRRDERGAHLAWAFPDLLLLPGEQLELPPVVLALHDRDWRAGADIYRRWAEAEFPPPEAPEWIAKRPAWAWVGIKGQHAPKVDRTFAELPPLVEELNRHGIPVPQVAGYMEHGHDTRFPDYTAGSEAGGEAGLVEAVRQIHNNGHRLALYTNGRLIDPEGSFGDIPHWQQHCVHLAPCAKQAVFTRSGTFTDPNPWDREGAMAKEQYNAVFFAIGCPGDPVWRDTFIERLEYLVREYDIDGIYIDQVCGCSSLPCYAENHEHAKPNQAWAGYLKLLRQLRERIRRIKPDVYLSTEGVCDVFGQFFDVQQAHNDWRHQVLNRADHLPEMYRHVYPGALVAIGPVGPEEDSYIRLGHSVMAGLDCFLLTEANSSPAFLATLKAALERRESLWPALKGSRVLPWLDMEPPGYNGIAVATGESVIVHGAWMGHEQNEPTPARVTVTLREAPAVSEGRLLMEERELPVEVDSREGTLGFELEGRDLFAVEFPRR